MQNPLDNDSVQRSYKLSKQSLLLIAAAQIHAVHVMMVLQNGLQHVADFPGAPHLPVEQHLAAADGLQLLFGHLQNSFGPPFRWATPWDPGSRPVPCNLS